MSESLPSDSAQSSRTIGVDDDDVIPDPPPPGDLDTASAAAATKNKVGEPSHGFDLNESVVYSHNWFSRIEVDGDSCGLCLLCDEEEKAAKASGKPLPKSRKKKSKVLKTPQGTTKPLFTHMSSHHKPEFVKMKEQEAEIETLRFQRKRKRSGDGDGTRQLQLIGGNNNVMGLNNKLDPKVQSRWDDAVVQFITETGNSFQSCEKLNILLKAIWPNGNARVKVRSRKTISKHVGEKSQDLKVEVYSMISLAKDETKGIAFTSDMWRSKSLDSFMSLTCHYIDKDFQLIKVVPFVTWFGHNRHTGVNMKLLLDQFFSVLGLNADDIIKTVVTDNASNNGVMFRLSRDTVVEYKCGIHTMSLAVKDVWQLNIINIKITDVLKKCKELAVFVRRSEHNKNDLKKECGVKDVRFIMPVLPNETRWHSVEANVRSVLHLTPALQSLAQNDTSLQWTDLVPNAAELKLLKSMVELLTRIKIACKIWESDSQPTIQTVIPELYDIIDVLDKKQRNRERYVSVFARELKKLVENRFPDSGTQNLVNCVAHLLDPEYRGIILKQYDGSYDRARAEVIKRGLKYEDVPPTAPEDQSMDDDSEENENENRSAAQRLKIREMEMDRVASARPDGISATEMEMQRFEQMKIGKCTSLLNFWKENEVVLPILAKIAREVYAVPASSASSEREFSIGALVCTAQRSRLLPEKVADLMLLKSNSEAVSRYKNTRGSIEAKYTAEEIKDLISVDFEQMENFDELTRRARAMETEDEGDEEYEYVEDMVERQEEEGGLDDVTLREVEDMI